MQDESIFPRGRVTILGVLNATPDSFSDGGKLTGADARTDIAAGLRAAEMLLAGGAQILDVGGESTRPGAPEVAEAVELERVIPLIEVLVRELSATVSIDTRKAAVASAALAAGATIVNDISGLKHDPTLADVVAGTPGTSLILGHIRGTPADMQDAPHYDDVLLEVATELEASVAIARAAGVADVQLAIDPGIGFGKGQAANLQLLAHVGWLGTRIGLPVLVGPSRKSFLGKITGDSVDQRETATLAACAVAAFTGADAVRVHDAAAARRAVEVGRALRDARRKELS